MVLSLHLKFLICPRHVLRFAYLTIPQKINIMDELKWSVYISYFSVLVPISFFILNKKKFKNKNLYILGIFLGVSAASDFIGYALMKSGISNIPLVNFYILIQFLLLSWMYWEFYGKEKKQFIKISAIIFVCIFLINTAFGEGLFVLQSYTNTASSVILIVIAYRFFRVLRTLPTVITKKITAGIDVHFKTLYFINIAVFFYFVLNLWLFTLSPVVLEIFNEEAPVNVWVFHNVMNIIKNIFFAVGLYWAGKKELV